MNRNSVLSPLSKQHSICKKSENTVKTAKISVLKRQ